MSPIQMTRRGTAAFAILTELAILSLAGGCNGDLLGGLTGPPKSLDNSGTQASDSGSMVGNWAIILGEFAGDQRYKQAEDLKAALVKARWTGIGVLHDSTRRLSFVFFGPFEKFENAEDQLKQVKSYRDSRGNRPFVLSYVRELPKPPLRGPAELDLRNANGYWTLQIAYFVDPGPAYAETQAIEYPKDWDRRKAAIEVAQALRNDGVEAYYYHGPKMSLVTVGAFPKEVFSYDPASKEYTNYDWHEDRYLDQRVLAYRSQRDFKYNLLNGARKVVKVYRPPGGRVVRRPMPSFLVQIPRNELFAH